MPPAGGFIQQDTSGDGGVERFNLTRRRDGDANISAAKDGWRDSAAFIAHNDRARRGKIALRERLALGGDGGEGMNAARGELVEEMVFVGGDAGQAKDGTGGCAKGLLIVRAYSAGQDDVSGCAEGFGRADERAEVAGVLKAGGNKDERTRPGKYLIESKSGRMNECCDSLRGLCVDSAGENLWRQGENVSGFRNFKALEHGLIALLNKHGVESEAACDSLVQQVFTLYGKQTARCSGGAREGAAQFLYPRILPTLYNAYVVCAVERGGHGCDSMSFPRSLLSLLIVPRADR